jgi:hypothetical protein
MLFENDSEAIKASFVIYRNYFIVTYIVKLTVQL